jgi:hypothetical protein
MRDGKTARLDFYTLERIFLVFGSARLRRFTSYMGREYCWQIPGDLYEFGRDDEAARHFLKCLFLVADHERTLHITTAHVQHAFECAFTPPPDAIPLEATEESEDLEEGSLYGDYTPSETGTDEEDLEDEDEDEDGAGRKFQVWDDYFRMWTDPDDARGLGDYYDEYMDFHARAGMLFPSVQPKEGPPLGSRMHHGCQHMPLPNPPPGCPSRFCCHQACNCRPADELLYEGLCRALEVPIGTDLRRRRQRTTGDEDEPVHVDEDDQLPPDVDADVCRFVHEACGTLPHCLQCTCAAALEHRGVIAGFGPWLEAGQRDPVAALQAIGVRARAPP